MKYLIFLFSFLINISGYSQKNIPEEIEIIEVGEVSGEDYEVPFVVIERAPVYKGCAENLDNSELKKCMSENITKHVLKKFNINVAKGLGLPDGNVRILAMFKVNKEGEVTEINVRGPHPDLEKEAFKAINSLPKFEKPGFQKGKAVIVPYALPIVFKVDNSLYLSEKEKKKLQNKKELP
ncbi:energy transducer TonB [Subsaxibacter sp. CAU 1640]|uniref:energy transducer TonB n=1 Tax=Subsaxibacter sp. CAU 1640 TaxID=2933271 RepID=UPI002006AC8C|nr:energy transducer TonB [Subsaxibacter sp. CAU 1640]MCK7590354.1 energy transducer TonB [Subsaxibacter sp. CAU 1640]